MRTSADIFGVSKAMVGMVHVGALPGTPRSNEPLAAIVARAVAEARMLAEGGFDAVMVENMHDLPYLRREVGPEIVAGMTAVARAVRAAISIPLGVQVLAGANCAAVAVAQAAEAQFIRAEGFVFAAVADEGILDQADAGPLLRYRKKIGAESIAVLADIKKKHSAHALTADVDIAEFARAAEFCGADGVIVTGVATSRPADINDLRKTRVATRLPVAVGSGTTPENIREMFDSADALIIGTWFKQRGEWFMPPDPARVRELVSAANRARR